MATNSFDDNTPDLSTSIPSEDHSDAHLTDTDYGLTVPVAPEGGIPAYPGNMDSGNNGNNGNNNNNDQNDNDYGLTTPVAPEGGRPAYPGNMNSGNNSTMIWPPASSTPSRPSTSIPVFPVFPSCPNCSGNMNRYGLVRFLNASANTFAVNINVDNNAYAINSRFGTVSNYEPVSDGFHTITVRRASGLSSILLQQSFPFSAGQSYTMVLTDNDSGGLDMVQVPATGCNTMNYNTGCYRVANMAYSGSSYDVMLYNTHSVVFRGLNYQNVSSYKQAAAGSYQFYLTNSSTGSLMQELPALMIGTVISGNFINEPLLSYQVDITAGGKYTSYIIGNTWSSNSLRVITLED